ncbi:hypothetical protein ACX1C1_10475 [Paenibacillus sp. strain BS8-2]
MALRDGLMMFNLVMLFFLVLVSCDASSNQKLFYVSEDESIDKGLKEVNGVLLDKENINDETVVVFKNLEDHAISISSVFRTKQGFEWNHRMPYFTCNQCTIEYLLSSNDEITIVIGTISDPAVKNVEVDHKYTLEVKSGNYVGINIDVEPSYEIQKIN